MKNDFYESMFQESDSYLEMKMLCDLKGGNKAKMNRFLQKRFASGIGTMTFSDYGDLNDYRKTLLFIKQGIVDGEIPIKLLWNALGCPRSIEECK